MIGKFCTHVNRKYSMGLNLSCVVLVFVCCIIGDMAKKEKKKTRKKKTDTGLKTRLIFETEDEELLEDESVDEEFGAGEILLDKESMRIIYNALKEYAPTEKEEHVHGILLEEFEETLVVEYGEPYPDVN